MELIYFFGFLLDKVKYSLEAANLAQRNASLGLYDASAGMLLQLLVGCSTLASIEDFCYILIAAT